MQLKLIFAVLLLSAAAAAACIPIEEAPKKIGATACVTGKVLKVAQSRSGNFFLDFCKNYRECPFTVFVPAKTLRDVGDVRQLEGKVIEIHGRIQQYAGRAEIILRDSRQLKGEAAKIPPVPKEFDAQRKGSFSAGQFERPHSRHTDTSERPPLPADDKQPQ